MRSLLLEERSSCSSIRCSSPDSGEADNKLLRLFNNYDNVFRLHPGPLPEQYRTLLNQMPTKEKKKNKKNKHHKHRGGDTPAGDDKTEEERRERKKHKKRDHDSDGGAAKKKKKEKKKKSRREDKDL